MKNINELLKEYESTNDILSRLEDYTHCKDGYICDIISEIADSETEVFTSKLFDWLHNDNDSIESIESALAEFGTPTHTDGSADFVKMIQQGQYYQNEQILYDNLEMIGKIWLLAYLRDIEKMTEITDEQAEFIDDLDTDNNDQFSDLLDKWNENND